jgi:hypothetical protein
VAHGPAGCGCVGGVNDGVRVYAVVAIKIGDGAGLTEMLDAKRLGAMAVDGSQPGERRRMAVEHGHQTAIARQGLEQPLDMAHRPPIAALPRTFGGLPSSIEAIGGGDCEETDVSAVLRKQADCRCGLSALLGPGPPPFGVAGFWGQNRHQKINLHCGAGTDAAVAFDHCADALRIEGLAALVAVAGIF